MGRLTPWVLSLVVLFANVACDDDDDDAGPPVDLHGTGANVHVTLGPFEIKILDPSGNEVLRTLTGGDSDGYGTPGAVLDDGQDGVGLIPGWDGYVPDEQSWTHPHTAKLITSAGNSASFQLGAIRVDVAIDGAKVSITTDATGGDPTWNKSSVSFVLRDDEHFFGLGERFAEVDHRGFSLYSWPEEGALGKGETPAPAPDNPYPNGPSMTYFPVPFFLSSAGYAVHLDTTYRTEAHLGGDRPDAWRAAVNNLKLTTVVYVHDDPLASLDDFTKDTGRPFVPASWVFGPRRIVERGQMALGELEYKLLREKHVPTTSVDDNVHFLPALSQVGQEDAIRQWVMDAHAAGYKVLAYNNPYVSTSIATAAADLAYGTQNNLLAKNPDGTLGTTEFISGTPQTLAEIDLTTPAGQTWFQSLLQRTLDFGYDGWMHDFGEYTRRGWLFGDGRNGEAVHNEFPVLSAKAAHDLCTVQRPNDFLFYVRSGYTGSTQYVPGVWSGDAEATFDDTQGLPANLRAGLNLGMSGVSTWGSQISGFKCITAAPNDKEVYLRWTEVGAVSPLMMNETACSNPLGNKVKWQLWNDQETIDTYARYARFHTRLSPYFDVAARQANATGLAIMRHPFLYYPHEPNAWAEDSSYFLGDSLYASPVVRRGATSKDAWLPPGTWVDFDDYTVYQGGAKVTFPAPLDKLPLVIKDGGILPMLDASVESLVPSTDPTIITADKVTDLLDVVVVLTPGKTTSITLADGTVLTATRGTAGGASSGLAAATADTIATCDAGCFVAADAGGVSRLQVTTPLAMTSDVMQDDMHLVATGPLARHIRWDVLRPKP